MNALDGLPVLQMESGTQRRVPVNQSLKRFAEQLFVKFRANTNGVGQIKDTFRVHGVLKVHGALAVRERRFNHFGLFFRPRFGFNAWLLNGLVFRLF